MKLPPWTRAVLGGVALVIAWWLVAKVVHLRDGDYSSDLFSHYQMSRGWLEGRPLLYENCYGFHHRLHNYYLLPAIGLLTYPLGVFGLFLAQALVLGCATGALVLRTIRQADGAGRWFVVAFLIVFWLGPVSFYVWDNPDYGFHAELLYPSLALLFVLALLRGRPWCIVLAAALLALNKEDGAVIGCSLSLASAILLWSDGRAALVRRLGAWLAGWVAVFLVGLLWLQLQVGFAGGRLAESLAAPARVGLEQLPRYLGASFGWPLLLTLPVLLVLVTLRGPRPVGALVLCSAPILVVNVVSSLWYYPDLSNGPSWAPRVASLWAYWLPCLALAVLKRPGDDRFSRLGWRSRTALFGAALVLQLLALRSASVPYAYFTRCFARPIAVLSGTPADPRQMFLNSVGRQLPDGYPVAPPSDAFAAFRRQEIFWWDHPQPGKAPALYVCEGRCDVRFPGFEWTGKSRFTLGAFEFIAEARLEPMIREQYARSGLTSGGGPR